MRATDITLPALSELGPEPLLQGKVYENRIARLGGRMAELGLETVVVYADREHARLAPHSTSGAHSRLCAPARRPTTAPASSFHEHTP